ncbi:MAG: hypothetical protein Q8O55_13325 [Dehalococcoidales bacterium]|nr:hypothetical protein [Dehalococcoidales bacterium]
MIDLLLRWWLRSGRYTWSRLRRWLFERRYRKTTLPAANSLEEIAGYLGQVTWTMDGPFHLYDAISYPETVWAKKKDDCDGFAILAANLLPGLGSNTDPVLITAILRPVRRSHTVCGFRNADGALSFFDNSLLRQGDFKEFGDIVALIKGDARLVCWDVRNPVTFDLVKFHRM